MSRDSDLHSQPNKQTDPRPRTGANPSRPSVSRALDSSADGPLRLARRRESHLNALRHQDGAEFRGRKSEQSHSGVLPHSVRLLSAFVGVHRHSVLHRPLVRGGVESRPATQVHATRPVGGLLRQLRAHVGLHRKVVPRLLVGLPQGVPLHPRLDQAL